MSAVQWVPLQRDYEAERASDAAKLTDAPQHPLLAAPTATKANESKPAAILSAPKPAPTSIPNPLAADPLSASLDPLSSSVNDPLLGATRSASDHGGDKRERVQGDGVTADGASDTFVPWSAMKPGILQTYTTDEQIGLQVTFMGTTPQGKAKVKTAEDKVRSRVEQLDQTEENEVKENMLMTQKDYVTHIESIHSDLIAAWDAEERVKSLKLSIQCAKLLNDTKVAKFYPSKFVLVTEILDTFGRLVYDRIKRRSTVGDGQGAKAAHAASEVNEVAKETCRNWLYKIASIRELLPRIYVEMAIIKCYEFLRGDRHTDLKHVINRLSAMCRGIGNPLIQIYARTYLIRKAHEVLPQYRAHLMPAFDDYLFTQQRLVDEERFQRQLKDELRVTKQEYLGLYSPALEWLLQCIAHGSHEAIEEVIRKHKESKNSIALNHIISSFHPDYVASHALSLTALIRDADQDSYPKHQLYRTLGVNLVLGSPPRDQVLAILNDVWRVVKKFTNVAEYIAVAEVFIEYPLKHCSKKETNILLGDIVAHVTVDKAYEQLQPQLQSIINKILAHYFDFELLIAMDNFLPLLDLFYGENQVQVAKAMLEAFTNKSNAQETTSDPLIINTMLNMGKALHDSLNSLSFQDEIRQVSSLLAQFIRRVDFGRDVEKQLNFYVDCRAAFANFDQVKARLVLGVCSLAVKTLKLVRGKHNKKTSAFVRACLAYSYITTPSMEDVFSRLQLYLISASVALMNQSVTQADSFLKAAITLVQEVPPLLEADNQVRSTEDQLVAYLQEFMALLVAVPGHPEHGPLYLAKPLLKVVRDYQWEKGSSGKLKVLVHAIPLLAAQFQTTLPYHVDGIDGNDAMFAEDAEFKSELVTLTNSIVEEVLEEMAKSKDDPDAAAQKKLARTALDLFNMTVSFAELNSKSATLAVNLYALAKRQLASTGADAAYLRSSIAAAEGAKGKLAAELAKKLKSM